MVVVIRCSYWFRSRVNSFLWRFHHTLVIPSSDVVQSRVTRTYASGTMYLSIHLYCSVVCWYTVTQLILHRSSRPIQMITPVWN